MCLAYGAAINGFVLVNAEAYSGAKTSVVLDADTVGPSVGDDSVSTVCPKAW